MTPGDHPSRPQRFKRTFLCAAFLTVLVVFLFYNMVLSDTDASKLAAQSSWNVPSLLHTALSRLQTVIILPNLSRKRKRVLLWTPYFSESRVWLPSTRDLECPVSDCDATDDRSLLEESDAVVLHWRDVNVNDLPRCEASTRCPRWVLFDKESPPHTPRNTLYAIQDRVHWTVTYRNDSDIFAPYGKVLPSKRARPDIPDRGSRGRLCWLVSNCHTPSERELFVQELQKYIDVDIYGRCGPLKCPLQQRNDCYNWLAQRCSLYLSFENSDCKDYMTEKLFNALISGMIPVVRGRSVNYSAFLPPRSFIDAEAFSSPVELAQYLKNVTTDARMYQSYHWWRWAYRAMDYSYRWYCDLCEKLHREGDSPPGATPGRDLVSWWYERSGCSS